MAVSADDLEAAARVPTPFEPNTDGADVSAEDLVRLGGNVNFAETTSLTVLFQEKTVRNRILF